MKLSYSSFLFATFYQVCNGFTYKLPNTSFFRTTTCKETCHSSFMVADISMEIPTTALEGSDSFDRIHESNDVATTSDTKIGILLLNLGGPEKTDDVEGKFQSHIHIFYLTLWHVLIIIINFFS